MRTGAHDPAPVRLAQTASHPVEWLRQLVRDAILARFAASAFAAVDDAGSGPSRAKPAGIVAALVVGDQNAIDRSDWKVFRATGVAHLMSISGLHVTLFAWFASAVLEALWRRTAVWGWSWCLRWPAPHAAAVGGGLLLACAYAVFSGWGVPAQRTVWMLAAVVVIDPWALYQAGFWLSFVAVGVLFAAGSATTVLPSVSSDPTEQVISQNGSILVRFHARIRAWLRNAHQFGGRAWLRNLLSEQWMVTWALTPLSILFFGQISVVGLVANLLAIPWVTLVVTPLAMAGVMWSPLWSVAVQALSPLQSLLGWMAALPWASAHVALPPLGLALWLPALAWHPPRPAPGHFEIQAPDLGQGNAVLVRTAQSAVRRRTALFRGR